MDDQEVVVLIGRVMVLKIMVIGVIRGLVMWDVIVWVVVSKFLAGDTS